MSRASSNPQKLGTPRRVASLSSQLDAFCRDLGGDRPIYRCCPSMISCQQRWPEQARVTTGQRSTGQALSEERWSQAQARGISELIRFWAR